MTLAIIELNDLAIRCSQGDLQLADSAGFALVQAGTVNFGQAAQQQARLKPRQTYNRFWQSLDMQPLNTDNPAIRHNADLAYRQLLAISEQLQPDTECILVIPSSFSRQQLALLLGLIEPLPLRIHGMIDRAVIATSEVIEAGHHLYLDLQLHQTVITQLDVNGEILCGKAHCLPQQGWQSLLDLLAQCITREFIKQTRFDPLHTAATEQILYDQIPNWLQQIQQHKDIDLEVDEKKIQLSQHFFERNLRDLFQPLTKKVTQLTLNGQIFFDQHWQFLDCVTEQLPRAHRLQDEDIKNNCLSRLKAFHSSAAGTAFTTSLPTLQRSEVTPAAVTSPTHILWRDCAYPLSDATCFLRDTSSRPIAQSGNGNCFAVIESGYLKPQPGRSIQLNRLPLSQPTELQSGDAIELPELDEPLKLICVKAELC